MEMENDILLRIKVYRGQNRDLAGSWKVNRKVCDQMYFKLVNS